MNTVSFLYSKRNWFGRVTKVWYDRKLPSNWAEVDADFFSLFSANFFGQPNPNAFVEKWASLPKKIGKLLRNYMVNEITKLLTVLFERPVSNEIYIKQISIAAKLKDEKPLLLLAPTGDMSDMYWAQFVDADNCIRAYSSTKDEKHLMALCAVLYRENPLEKYDTRLVKERATIFETVDAAIIKSVHLNFICFLNWLVDTYPALYSNSPRVDGNEITFAAKTESAPDYTDLVYKLASPKLGTVDQIEQMPAGYVFWLLSRRD